MHALCAETFFVEREVDPFIFLRVRGRFYHILSYSVFVFCSSICSLFSLTFMRDELDGMKIRWLSFRVSFGDWELENSVKYRIVHKSTTVAFSGVALDTLKAWSNSRHHANARSGAKLFRVDHRGRCRPPCSKRGPTTAHFAATIRERKGGGNSTKLMRTEIMDLIIEDIRKGEVLRN